MPSPAPKWNPRRANSLPPAEARQQAMQAVKSVYDDLEKLVDSLPARDCIARTACCKFKLTGRTPFLTPAEAVYAAHTWRASGRTRLTDTAESTAEGQCPCFCPRTQRCLNYEGRPLGCRTHFCAAAGGPWPRRELQHLVHRLEDASLPLGNNTEARPLPAAMAEALKQLT